MKRLTEYMLKYDTYTITYKELPNEVALTITITNCPFSCPNCHSPHLREDIGHSIEKLIPIIDKYKQHITAICFLGHGGKKHKETFLQFLKKVQQLYPTLRMGVYSGFEYMFEEFQPYLYYYKVGKYIEKLGGLASPTTNQRLHILK